MSDIELLRRNCVDYSWRLDLDNLDVRADSGTTNRDTQDIYYYRNPSNPGTADPHAADDLTSSPFPGDHLVSLFNNNDNFVDFNFLMVGQYKPGSQYDALGGDDKVYLPNDMIKAQFSGYDPNNFFNGGHGNDLIYGGALNDTIQGDSGIDTIFGGAGNDKLNGGTGDDFIDGGEGDDKIFGDANNDYLSGNLGSDELSGGAGNDWLDGSAGIDHLMGGGGNDTLDGGLDNGTAIDTLEGGKGDDTYIAWDNSDVLVEKADEGTDLVQAWANYTLGENIENLILMGTTNLNGTGNGLNNVITGNIGSNQIDGGAGNDHLYGGDGNDNLMGGLGIDTLHGGNGNDHLSGGDDFDNLFGGLGDDVLSGGNSFDFLAGGAGKDILIGGVGGKDSFGFDLGEGAASIDLADVIEDFEDGVDVLYEGALDKSKILFLSNNTDAILYSIETNQYICVIKNCAGKISLEDFTDGP